MKTKEKQLGEFVMDWVNESIKNNGKIDSEEIIKALSINMFVVTTMAYKDPESAWEEIIENLKHQSFDKAIKIVESEGNSAELQ